MASLMTDLRDWLKAHNIKNSMGGEMSYNTIQRMLSNRRYIGELRLPDRPRGTFWFPTYAPCILVKVDEPKAYELNLM